MKFYTKIFFLSLIVCSYSCSQQIYFLEGNKVTQDLETNQDKIIISADYAGDAIDYIIFELSIKNNSEDTLFINTEDITFRISDNDSISSTELIPLEKNELIATIEYRKEDQRVQKKFRTLNLVIGGLEIISTLLSPGLSAGSRILYAVEPAAYMANQHRSTKLIERSLDEQIEYLDDWAFVNAYILPGAEGSWDLLFESVLINGRGELKIENDHISFNEKFDLYIDLLDSQ